MIIIIAIKALFSRLIFKHWKLKNMSSYRKGKMVCDFFVNVSLIRLSYDNNVTIKKVYNSTKYDLIYKREIYQPAFIL